MRIRYGETMEMCDDIGQVVVGGPFRTYSLKNRPRFAQIIPMTYELRVRRICDVGPRLHNPPAGQFNRYRFRKINAADELPTIEVGYRFGGVRTCDPISDTIADGTDLLH